MCQPWVEGRRRLHDCNVNGRPDGKESLAEFSTYSGQAGSSVLSIRDATSATALPWQLLYQAGTKSPLHGRQPRCSLDACAPPSWVRFPGMNPELVTREHPTNARRS